MGGREEVRSVSLWQGAGRDVFFFSYISFPYHCGLHRLGESGVPTLGHLRNQRLLLILMLQMPQGEVPGLLGAVPLFATQWNWPTAFLVVFKS